MPSAAGVDGSRLQKLCEVKSGLGAYRLGLLASARYFSSLVMNYGKRSREKALVGVWSPLLRFMIRAG